MHTPKAARTPRAMRAWGCPYTLARASSMLCAHYTAPRLRVLTGKHPHCAHLVVPRHTHAYATLAHMCASRLMHCMHLEHAQAHAMRALQVRPHMPSHALHAPRMPRHPRYVLRARLKHFLCLCALKFPSMCGVYCNDPENLLQHPMIQSLIIETFEGTVSFPEAIKTPHSK